MDCLKSKSNLKSYQHLPEQPDKLTPIDWGTPVAAGSAVERRSTCVSRKSQWNWTNDFRLLGKPDNRECDDIDYLSEHLQILIELKHELEKYQNEAIAIDENNQNNDYQRNIQEKERQIEYIRDRLQLLSYSSPRLSIAIDPEFKVLIPPLSREEKAQLEANLREQGCRDALVVWKGHNLLIDGHNRHEICIQYGIEFQTIEIDLPSREAVRDWIIDNQLGRRNLTPEMVSYLRGKQYNAMKHSHGGNRRAKAQNEPLFNTAQLLAKKYKVGKETIKRDAKLASEIDLIAALLGEDIRVDLLNRDLGLTRKEIHNLASVVTQKPEFVKTAIAAYKEDKSQKTLLKPKPRKLKGAKQPYLNCSQLKLEVGTLVQIRLNDKSDNDLNFYNHCYAVVTEIRDYSLSVRTWTKDLQVSKLDVAKIEENVGVCVTLSPKVLGQLMLHFSSLEEVIAFASLPSNK
jgi:hypothetical protein